MTRLTKQEMHEIQAFIDRKIESADELGLTLKIDDDMWDWRALMDSAPGAVGASKTLDPMFNDVRPGNSFWLGLVDQSGDIIGCQANRFVESEDFIEEFVSTHRFFGNRCPSLRQDPIQLKESIPVLRGRLNFGGGGWVHPDWRGKGIAGFMSRVCRTLALRHYLIDYYVCFMSGTSNRRQYGLHRQGLLNRRHLLAGGYPGRGGESDVDIYWLHRGELMNQISLELSSSLDSSEALMMRMA